MKNILAPFMVILLVLALHTCANGGHTGQVDGDSSDGDKADGDLPDGDSSDGDRSDGDTSDGDTSDGDLDPEPASGTASRFTGFSASGGVMASGAHRLRFSLAPYALTVETISGNSRVRLRSTITPVQTSK